MLRVVSKKKSKPLGDILIGFEFVEASCYWKILNRSCRAVKVGIVDDLTLSVRIHGIAVY